MLKVNGVVITTPSSLSVEISDLDGESNRNANGMLVRDRIAVKRKLNLEWKQLSQSEMSTLLRAVSNVFFTVTYIDPIEGEITKTMYVGDRSAPMYQCINGVAKWSSLKMNFIEK